MTGRIEENQSWKAYSNRLGKVLGLKGSPVAVTYSNVRANSMSRKRHRVCEAIPAARDGEVINLSRATCSCRGGANFLGLGPPREKLEEFLVYSEKLWDSIATARRALTHILSRAPSPTGLSRYVVFSPLEKAELEPDLVLFLCSPEQGCRLTALASYREGAIPPSEMGGSLCWSSVTYPLVTGNINVSLGDFSARRTACWNPLELIVSIPAHKIPQIVDNINRCSAGTAKPPENSGD